MPEQRQMVHMLVRVSRLAAERWGLSLAETMRLLGPTGVLLYIGHNFGLFHMEGDEAVLDDVEGFPATKGVDPYATA